MQIKVNAGDFAPSTIPGWDLPDCCAKMLKIRSGDRARFPPVSIRANNLPQMVALEE